MLNQDKYKTAEERNHAFSDWCFNRDCKSCNLKAHNIDGDSECRFYWDSECRFYWLALEAEEEKPEPCPFCGNRYLAITKDGNNLWSVSCTACLYESRHHADRDTSIAAHNRVARAVMAAKEDAK